ncbi:MAG: manganese efflux pump MntP family protein [Verrucomicrobiae bacterium]|nr:manganese efflux pump MntP family protein [Verrucomicrobiae bacterium]
MWQVFFIALALAVDAFAVAVASGVAIKDLRAGYALRIAFWFGMFQAIMPLAGWLAGVGFKSLFSFWDHWIAFGLLTVIGGKMIYESFQLKDEKTSGEPHSTATLFLLSVATSIDALAVGFTLALLGCGVFAPVCLIGAVTFVISLAGVYIGDHFGHFFEEKIELLGGVVLFGIGVKILVEHLR